MLNRAHHTQRQILFIGLVSLFASACSMLSSRDGAPDKTVDISRIPDAQPRAEPLSKHGNPESYKVDGERYYVLDSSKDYRQTGTASWYGTKFHGQRTSSGEIYDMYAMTAAHKTLPLPTYVKVTNLANRRSVVVKVNDRGPFVDDRIIDLSYVAAKKLGILGNGTAQVEVSAIDPTALQTDVAPATATAPEANTIIASAPAPIPDTNAQVEKQTPDSGTVESAEGESYNFHYLQIGAYTDFVNAEHALAKLILQTSQPAHISMGTTTENKPIYRVRLGPYTDREHSKTIETQLEEYGYQYTHVSTD